MSSESGSTHSQKKVVKRIKRKRLTEAQVKHLLLRRYGSVTDFSQPIATISMISRATGLHYQTIKDVIQRYHRNGNSYDHDVFKSIPRPKKLSSAFERQLVSYEVLNEMRFLSLERRSRLIEEQYQVRVPANSLALIYARHGVHYKKTKKATR